MNTPSTSKTRWDKWAVVAILVVVSGAFHAAGMEAMGHIAGGAAGAMLLS
jgi:hypothetical protein